MTTVSDRRPPKLSAEERARRAGLPPVERLGNPDVVLDTVCGERSDNPDVSEEDEHRFTDRMRSLRLGLQRGREEAQDELDQLRTELEELQTDLHRTQDRLGSVTRQRDNAREELSLDRRTQTWDRKSLEVAVRAQRTEARRARAQRDELLEVVRGVASELRGDEALHLRDRLYTAYYGVKEGS